MKKIISLLMLICLPLAIAAPIEIGIGIGASASNNPLSITVNDKGIYESTSGPEIIRANNYAFIGELFYYNVTVTDIDGAADINVVAIMLGTSGVTCNQYDVGANYISYDCWYAVQPSNYGNYEVKVIASDNGGATYSTPPITWFVNPTASLTVTDNLVLPTGLAGSTKTSNTVGVVNGGEGGIILNMEIRGNDLYDNAHSLAMCPTSNQLALSNIDYYAEIGIYDSGWTVIPYSYNDVITGNSELSAGNTMDLTLQITYPTPCYGDYTGTIYISGSVV